MYQMSIMVLWTAYEPIAHMTTISGVRIANGIFNIDAKKGTNASTIRTPMMLPVYMLAMSPQTKSGFSVKRSGPGWRPQMMSPPSMTELDNDTGRIAENTGSTDVSAASASSGAKEAIRTIEKSAPRNGDLEDAVSD